MSNELPEPWASELSGKGIHSYRDLGAAAHIAHETARRLCTGGKTSSATVNKVAAQLFDGDSTKVWSLYGAALEDYGPWELPPEATLLRPDQRDAILAIVKAMLPTDRAGGGDGDAESTEPRGSAPTRAKKDMALAADEQVVSIEDEQEGTEGSI